MKAMFICGERSLALNTHTRGRQQKKTLAGMPKLLERVCARRPKPQTRNQRRSHIVPQTFEPCRASLPRRSSEKDTTHARCAIPLVRLRAARRARLSRRRQYERIRHNHVSVVARHGRSARTRGRPRAKVGAARVRLSSLAMHGSPQTPQCSSLQQAAALQCGAGAGRGRHARGVCAWVLFGNP